MRCSPENGSGLQFSSRTFLLYVVTLCVYQIGLVVTGAGSFGIGTIVALILAAILLFLLFRPDPYKNQNDVTKRSVQAAE